jgi:hypothetical protein
MRYACSTFAMFYFALVAIAAPPAVVFPKSTEATSEYVTIIPKTDAKSITYVGQSGIEPFPSSLLSDPKAFVLPVRGLPQGTYKFVGVASLNDEHNRFDFEIIIGQKASPVPVPPNPVPPNPNPNPAPNPGLVYDPPVWVYLVEDVNKRTPEIVKVLADEPFWKGLETAGYGVRFYDITSADAKRMGFDTLKDKSGQLMKTPFIFTTDKAGKPIVMFSLPADTETIGKNIPAIKK